MATKYIFTTGGVVSSLGKGLASASIGNLLEARGYSVTLQKLDPYLNVDPGTMSPFQHGEVFVTDDGTETDLDLGHYERFTTAIGTKAHNWTTGKIYERVIGKERRGEYLGKTVQVIPHVTDEIKAAILSVGRDVDVVIVEIGGTVGDIESLPFLEAIRQFQLDVGRDNAIFVHLTLLPYIRTAGEVKTKPTQHSVKALREIGIQPDILLCRTERPIGKEIKEKISLFCNVAPEAVITAIDVDWVYEVPLRLHGEGLDRQILRLLHLPAREADLGEWGNLVERLKHPSDEVSIAMLGKYVNYEDSYKSLNEALVHGGIANDVRVNFHWVEAEEVEGGHAAEMLEGVDGLLVPGGFGERGIQGMIEGIQWAREEKVPFFGICLGMQCAVIEWARNRAALRGAHSSEFDETTEHRVIVMQKELEELDLGGTMRLGAYPCVLAPGTRAHDAYGADLVQERHRHRYEVNPAFLEALEGSGLVISGHSPERTFVEIIEDPTHPWFLACQFHPEFKSKPLAPHPLFRDFIQAAHVRKRHSGTGEDREVAPLEKPAPFDQTG